MTAQLAPDRVAKAFPVRIAKADGARQIAYAVVLEPRTEDNPDSQGDYYDAAEVEKAAHRWLSEHVAKGEPSADLMHDETTEAGVPVESYIAPVDFAWGTGDKVELVKAGSWVIGMYYADDQIWDRIVKGELAAFSVGGSGTRIHEVKS